MKIKACFVTNSSSTTYIIIDTENSIHDLAKELKEWDKDGQEFSIFEIREYECFRPDEIEKLKTFNNFGKELDWVSAVMGARYNKLGNEKIYKGALEALKGGSTIHFLIVNNNMWLDNFLGCYDNLKLGNCSDWYDDMEWKDE